jgi:thioredoxin reductase/NAD-dependent dihydropyrimidine dehydrogenase PreA subunit
MVEEWSLFGLYGGAIAAVLFMYVGYRRYIEVRARAVLKDSIEQGLVEPPSLHPVIDAAKCCGSGACITACPERAIGIINGKAVLVNPTHCIGHGACLPACPMKAITLVFGTEKRGVDIPFVKPNFETNVPQLYIAGELGGMGLIRKAAEQGRKALESIKAAQPQKKFPIDVVIVGAGPAGIAASLAAIEQKMNYITLEQEDSLGGSVYHYPRNKITMAGHFTLPIVGKFKLGETTKEALLEMWQGIVKRTGLTINFRERLESIETIDGGFLVKSDKASYETGSVLLTIGRRGTPRKLGVPGEESPKVVYRLIDAEQYRGQSVLVAGGGDSAIEAAMSIAAEPGSKVALCYRGEAFNRIKPGNRDRLAASSNNPSLQVMLKTDVIRIDEKRVVVRQDGVEVELENDAVIICAGGDLPTKMLQKLGVEVATHHGDIAALEA